jgi:hypothetical protein
MITLAELVKVLSETAPVSPELMKTLSEVESDPNGLPLNTPGAKADKGKNRVGLVIKGFAYSLSEVSKVGTYGAEKYTDRGFLSVPDGVERYTDAMMRHFLAEEIVGPIDPERGLLHAAHLAWNALARLELMLREPKQ